MADLDAGLDRFLTAVEAAGVADEVLVVTLSEFGRRAQENGSGTDHGNAGHPLRHRDEGDRRALRRADRRSGPSTRGQPPVRGRLPPALRDRARAGSTPIPSRSSAPGFTPSRSSPDPTTIVVHSFVGRLRAPARPPDPLEVAYITHLHSRECILASSMGITTLSGDWRLGALTPGPQSCGHQGRGERVVRPTNQLHMSGKATQRSRSAHG